MDRTHNRVVNLMRGDPRKHLLEKVGPSVDVADRVDPYTFR
jgi:hypothetical protein